MKASDARKNVVDSFDLSEAINLITEESLKGNLQCHFHKGNCIDGPVALDYSNGLIALGFQVRPYGPYLIRITWDNLPLED